MSTEAFDNLHSACCLLLSPDLPLLRFICIFDGHFLLIWRPHEQSQGSDHFLQLNLTNDSIEFDNIGGPVPNRGFSEPDIAIYAVRYLQQIHDANFPPPNGGGGLHVEPGFWLSVPANAESGDESSLFRCASIPHGTTVLAQGSAVLQSPPIIPGVSTVPFFTANGAPQTFPESNLQAQSAFRTSPLPDGISQEIVDNPNVLLSDALTEGENQGFKLLQALMIQVNSISPSVVGQTPIGSIGNIPFLSPNAEVVDISATIWLEQFENGAGASFLQLQYSQTVLLNFNTLSWPHVTVGTLVKAT
jgi:hypothetical protein